MIKLLVRTIKKGNYMEFDKITIFLDSLVKDNIAPGVDCIITKNHNRIYRYYTGKSDIANNVAINGKEKYIIYSMTKMVTCVCALQLLEKDKYNLDDPLSKFIPAFSDMNYRQANGSIVKARNPITIRHLFSMSAGFNYNIEEKCITKEARKKESNTQSIVKSFSKMVLDFEPGSHFQYSLCHDILGALIEIWSGMKFSDYFEKYIAHPLELKNTFFSKYNNENVVNLAKIYKVNPYEPFDDRPQWNPYVFCDNYESGGAGLISTTEDYSIFLEALANDGFSGKGYQLLKKDTIELMKTNQLSEVQLEDFHKMRNGYGYGLGVRTHMQPEISGSLSPIGEFGWDGAAGAFSMVDLKNKISLTYFQHALGWDVKLQMELRNLLYESLINKN